MTDEQIGKWLARCALGAPVWHCRVVAVRLKSDGRVLLMRNA